jgi:hypothetical protein
MSGHAKTILFSCRSRARGDHKESHSVLPAVCGWREGRIVRGSPFGGKSPRNRTASLLVAFRGEDGCRIGAGNFAHRDPANPANQRAD